MLGAQLLLVLVPSWRTMSCLLGLGSERCRLAQGVGLRYALLSSIAGCERTSSRGQ